MGLLMRMESSKVLPSWLEISLILRLNVMGDGKSDSNRLSVSGLPL